MTSCDWSAFDWLIAPTDRTTFLREVWEQRPHAIHRTDRSYFASLVARADVDTIASMFRVTPVVEDQRTQPIRLVRSPDGRYSSEPVVAGHDGSPDLHCLYRAYASGSTVIIGPLGSRWLPVAQLCARLELALHHRVSANLYLTPPDAQGFPVHHDTHDAFIVQVEGSKSWRVYHPGTELPLVDAPFRDLMPAQDGARDVHLNAGDVLYLPRGWLHEAHTGTVPSLHITLGVHVARWADVLTDVVTAVAERDVGLRRAVPVGFMHGAVADGLRGHVRALLAELAGVDDAALDQAIDRVAERFLQSAQSTTAGHFLSLTEVPALTVDSNIQIVAPLCRVVAGGDVVRLQTPGRELHYPSSVERTLRHLATGEQSAVGALPGGLSDDAKLVLVRRLVRDGVVRVVTR